MLDTAKDIRDAHDALVNSYISIKAAGPKKLLTISGAITTLGNFTYPLVFTCTDEYNKAQLNFPFRVIVYSNKYKTTL